MRLILLHILLAASCIQVSANCSLDLRDYIAQTKSTPTCAEYFVKDLRKGPQSKTLLELNLLGEKADRNVVLGLLVLATKGVGYDETIANAYGQFQGELNKVTKKTKKTSDAYVLKQFFVEVKKRFDEHNKLSDVAKKIKFREPRQQPQRKQVTIDFSKLRAAPCMRTLDATVMRMLGNDEEATVCAVQFRSALNMPGKRNSIVSDYNKKASKLSGQVFKVDADLAPHKANKAADGKVEMSYKGIIQGVIKATTARQKFSNVRIARILQVQGLSLENLPTWETQDPDPAPSSTKRKRSTADDFDESPQKRRKFEPAPPMHTPSDQAKMDPALLREIQGYDKDQLKKVEIKVAPTLLEKTRHFVATKPGDSHKKPVDIRLDPKIAQFLKTLFSRLPRELGPPQNQIVPYQPKQQPEPVMVTVILPEGFKVLHYGAPKNDTPKTAEERGLAIVPYRGGQAGNTSAPDRIHTTVIPSGTILKLQGVMGKILKNKPLKPLEVRDVKDLLRTLIILPPASPGPMRALPAPGEKSRTSLEDQDDWFRRPAEVGGKDSFSTARARTPQAQPAPKKTASKRQLALPAPEENMVCLTGGLSEALKEVYSGQIDPWYRKRCASQILQRISADLSNPHTLQGDMMALTVADKKAVSDYLQNMKEGKRPVNQTRLIVRKLIEGKTNQQQPGEYGEEKAGGVIALPYKSNSPPSSETRKKTLEMRRRGEKIQPAKYPGAAGRQSSQGSRLATIKEQSSGVMKEQCSASSAGGILQELYDGDLACAELAKQQWQSNTGSIGAFKEKLNETKARVVERVISHQLTHLRRLKAGTGVPQAGKLDRSDEIAFQNILERLKKGTLGLKPKQTRLSVCPTSLERALSFILDARQGDSRKECFEQMKNLINNTEDPNTKPSEAELSLGSQLALLTEQQYRNVELFITTLVENKEITKQQKQQALEGLLLNLSTKRTPKKRTYDRPDEDDEERIKELYELNKKVEKCGQDYSDTLNILRSPWTTEEMKKRCAGLALAVLDGHNQTNFYKALGKLGTSGTAKQKEDVQTFFGQLEQIHAGKIPARIVDPMRV